MSDYAESLNFVLDRMPESDDVHNARLIAQCMVDCACSVASCAYCVERIIAHLDLKGGRKNGSP